MNILLGFFQCLKGVFAALLLAALISNTGLKGVMRLQVFNIHVSHSSEPLKYVLTDKSKYLKNNKNFGVNSWWWNVKTSILPQASCGGLGLNLIFRLLKREIYFQQSWLEFEYFRFDLVQFSSAQSLNCVQLFATPWTVACQSSCPSPTPGVYLNSCPSSRWCHSTISSSVIPFSSCSQSFPASGSFPMSQLFASGGQSFGVSASTSVLPVNTED